MKYQHLHSKIKSVRENLGLTQKEFASKVSEQLKRDKLLSAGLVSQWESLRTTPTEPQIAAIAQLSRNSWWTMLWFMHDDLPADRDVDYHQDGSFTVAPEFTDEEIDEMSKEMEKEKSQPPEPHVVAWMQDPKAIHQLRETMRQNDLLQRRSGSGTSTDDKATKSAHPVSGDVTVQITGVSATTAVGNVTVSTADDESSKSFYVRRGPILLDLIQFKNKEYKRSSEGDRARAMGEQDESDDRVERIKRFEGAFQYALEERFGIGDVDLGLHRVISHGVLKTRAFFYLHGISVQMVMMDETTQISLLALRLREKIGDLLLIDRMQNRAAKKLVLFATYQHGLDLEPLRERYSQHVQSAALLGIKVAFASGPEEAASEVTNLISGPHPDK